MTVDTFGACHGGVGGYHLGGGGAGNAERRTTYIYICIYMYTYIYMYRCIYIYTYIHPFERNLAKGSLDVWKFPSSTPDGCWDLDVW